jgi:hypothetical protein
VYLHLNDQPGASLPRARGCFRLYCPHSGFLSRRWGLPPPRFPLRSACLGDGSLPRATKRLVSCARTCALVWFSAAEVYNDENFVAIIAAAVLANCFIVVGRNPPTTLVYRSRALRPPPAPPAPSRSSKTPPPGEASPGRLVGLASTAKPLGRGKNHSQLLPYWTPGARSAPKGCVKS